LTFQQPLSQCSVSHHLSEMLICRFGAQENNFKIFYINHDVFFFFRLFDESSKEQHLFEK